MPAVPARTMVLRVSFHGASCLGRGVKLLMTFAVAVGVPFGAGQLPAPVRRLSLFPSLFQAGFAPAMPDTHRLRDRLSFRCSLVNAAVWSRPYSATMPGFIRLRLYVSPFRGSSPRSCIWTMAMDRVSRQPGPPATTRSATSSALYVPLVDLGIPQDPRLRRCSRGGRHSVAFGGLNDRFGDHLGLKSGSALGPLIAHPIRARRLHLAATVATHRVVILTVVDPQTSSARATPPSGHGTHGPKSRFHGLGALPHPSTATPRNHRSPAAPPPASSSFPSLALSAPGHGACSILRTLGWRLQLYTTPAGRLNLHGRIKPGQLAAAFAEAANGVHQLGKIRIAAVWRHARGCELDEMIQALQFDFAQLFGLSCVSARSSARQPLTY